MLFISLNYDSYTGKQNEVLMNKPIYLGFAVLALSNLIKYETLYDKLQQLFGQKNLQIYCMDYYSFVVSIRPQNLFNDSQNLEQFFDFSNLNENHQQVSNRKKRVVFKL